jgi:hypothetical protein
MAAAAMTVGAGSTGAAASSTGPAVARSADQEGHRGHLIRSLPEWIGGGLAGPPCAGTKAMKRIPTTSM